MEHLHRVCALVAEAQPSAGRTDLDATTRHASQFSDRRCAEGLPIVGPFRTHGNGARDRPDSGAARQRLSAFGHSPIGVTTNVYAHVLDDSKREMTSRMDRFPSED
ncbi:hypothetical protein [Bounagaea algeriensis]